MTGSVQRVALQAEAAAALAAFLRKYPDIPVVEWTVTDSVRCVSVDLTVLAYERDDYASALSTLAEYAALFDVEPTARDYPIATRGGGIAHNVYGYIDAATGEIIHRDVPRHALTVCISAIHPDEFSDLTLTLAEGGEPR